MPEIALIDAALRHLSDGSGTAVHFVGEPGIGKTALLNAVQQRSNDRRFASCSAAAEAPVAPLSYADQAWNYRLESQVPPPFWIPFLPERIAPGSAEVRLRRARMQQWAASDLATAGPHGVVPTPVDRVGSGRRKFPAPGSGWIGDGATRAASTGRSCLAAAGEDSGPRRALQRCALGCDRGRPRRAVIDDFATLHV
jgi:AAA ATPase domain